MRLGRLPALLGAGLLAHCGCTDLGDEAGLPDGADETSFVEEVAPILQANCIVCHGAGGGEAGLDLSSRDGLLAGGASGPAVVEGNAAGSLLVQRISAADPGQRMPPGGQLAAGQISTIRDWIDEGALDN